MKKHSSIFVWIIGLSLIIQSNSIWATQLARDEYFNKNWAYEKAVERTDGTSLVKVKLFKRYLWINQTPISVAETTFTYLKNPQDHTTPNELSKKIISSFPRNVLKANKIQDGILLEGHWKSINRYVRIDLLKKENQILIISSFARHGLKNALIPEINQLHALLRTYRGETDAKTSFLNFFQKLFVDEAQAQAIPGIPGGITNLIGGSNNPIPGNTVSTGTGTTTTAVNGSGVTMTNNITNNTTVNVNGLADVSASINTQGTQINNNISNVNNSINNNLGNMNATVNNQGQQFNNNYANTNTILNNQAQQLNNTAAKEGARFNDNWAESNKIASKMLDPDHMAKVAFYTAAGAALGSLAVNLAVEGISTGMSFLYELFTGTKKKKLEWDDFQKAIQTWDSEQSNLAKMESAVDELILAFEFFQDKNMGSDYVANLKRAMQDMSFDRDIYIEKFKEKDQSIACRRVFHNAAEELDQKLKEYEKLVGFAEKNNIASDSTENYFCSQLKEMQRKILSTEAEMQNLRLSILKAESQFYAKDSEAKEKSDDNIEEINDAIVSTMKKRERYDKEVRTRVVDEYNEKRDVWVKDCKARRNDAGKKLFEELGLIQFYYKSNGRCLDLYSQKTLANPIDPEVAQTFQQENKLRKELDLHANTAVDFKLSQDQMNWFTRMHMDAYCYQFAHGPKENIPEKCNAYPEMLYSLSMSKGHDKAASAYKDKCEDRYLEGVRKLAATPK